MRIWLDDVRPPPLGWTWFKTVDQVLARIEQGGVTELSLDHDLDYSDPGRHGIEVAVWVRDQMRYGRSMPVVHVHTANPNAASDMALLRQLSEYETGQWDRWVDAASKSRNMKRKLKKNFR